MGTSRGCARGRYAAGRWVLVGALWGVSLMVGSCSGGDSSPGTAGVEAGTDVTTTDTAPPCPTGQTVCGSSCTDTTKDPGNCGTCSHACSGGMVCNQGACALSCATGLTPCGQSCVETQVDPAHCGGCNQPCGAGQACAGGTCQTLCPPPEVVCSGDGGGYCANTKNDGQNCGACRNACPEGQVCSAGACGVSCQPNETLCLLDGGAPYCANTKSDNANCGACGMACGQGQACSGGACATSCQPNETLCTPDGGAPYCANTQSDNDNCGVCGNACAVGLGYVCVKGMCVYSLVGTSPQPVNGTLSGCTTGTSYGGRKVAIDGMNWIYGGMICGGNGEVAVSADGGVTYAPPVALPFSAIVELALQGGPEHVVYAAGLTSTGILFTVSADGGATWSPAEALTTMTSPFGLSVAAFGDHVYVALSLGSGTGPIEVFHNAARGAGAFTSADATFPTGIDPFDVLTNPATGDVWVVGDNVNLLSTEATDQTASLFPPPVVAAGASDMYTDWTLGGGNLLVAGSGTQSIFIVPTSAPTTQTSVALTSPPPAAQARAISADPRGNAYVVSELASGGPIALERLAAGAMAVDPIRSFGTGATWPGVQAGPNNTAVVVYTQGTTIFATTQAY